MKILTGQAPNLKPADLEFIKPLSTPGKMCLYHVDVASQPNSIYFRKIKEHGLFGDFVDRYRELLESDKPIKNRQGFFQQMLILPTYNIESKSLDFYKLWSDSFAELDPETRMRFYHHVKLDFERKAEEECHAFGAFERLRFEAKDKPEIVVVEGHCKGCGFYTPTAFKLNWYMEIVNRGDRTY
ncbi:MAG: hypothetical protein WAM14_17775 [Candidatus Nitrosopolaris sp.]